MQSSLHSLVIPVFNEESVLPELKSRLFSEFIEPLKKMGDSVEVIFVDDGSKDRSLDIIDDLHQKSPEIFKLISFSRNFGHQIAISAGIDHTKGDTITVIDADLQDPPRVVIEMIDLWKNGYDVVFAKRKKRHSETIFKLLTATLFYRALKSSTGFDIPLDTGDFRLMGRNAANALIKMRERHRFVRGMAAWVGFKQGYVEYDREARFAGETKYPLSKMIRLAWDGFTGFSLIPLRLATFIGIASAGLSIALTFWTLFVRIFTNEAVKGWSSLMLAVLFIGGIQLFAIGILGEYVGRIFEQTKNRPLYLIKKSLGDFDVISKP